LRLVRTRNSLNGTWRDECGGGIEGKKLKRREKVLGAGVGEWLEGGKALNEANQAGKCQAQGLGHAKAWNSAVGLTLLLH
jgi:hypothetical protein